MALTDVKLRTLKTPGKHFDGEGLYLEITPAGGRYWRWKFLSADHPKVHQGPQKYKKPLRINAQGFFCVH
jgi:hypothetical protein